MAQKKLLRFAQIKEMPHVLEYPENMKGEWHSFFKNNNPIVLELACGRGEYAIGLAGLCNNKNFIGVDVKGNRMYIGAKKAMDLQYSHVAFLRTQIEMINQYFDAAEVDEIWITFPDPQLRTSKAKKRLTHPRFLRETTYSPQVFAVVSTNFKAGRLYSFKNRFACFALVYQQSDRYVRTDPVASKR